MRNCADIAAQIHANMCDDNGFGYSWGERYGTDSDTVTWNINGQDYCLDRGDYDCSSSVITAWKKALEGTEYEGVLDGAGYTGNMRSVFSNSGLFDVWDTSSTQATRGDVYLNDSYHTAMCQDGGSDGVYGYDALSEFCINENGTVYGGQRGDQTGNEAYIHGYYDYPWNCTLHYNGAADSEEDVDGSAEDIVFDIVGYLNDDDMNFNFGSDEVYQNVWNGGHTLTYKNENVNGNKDLYQLITDASKTNISLDSIMAKIDKITSLLEV